MGRLKGIQPPPPPPPWATNLLINLRHQLKETPMHKVCNDGDVTVYKTKVQEELVDGVVQRCIYVHGGRRKQLLHTD